MNLQLFQFISILIFVSLFYGAYRIKNNKVKVFLIALGLILFFMNPVRFKQEGVASLERFKSPEIKIPDRISVKQKEFDEVQKQEYTSLKNESKELTNETIE